MIAAKHTPGPWTVEGQIHSSGEALRIQGLDAYGVHGYNVADVIVANGDPQNDANARLIAAAPDLLEALQSAVALTDKNKAAAEDEGRWVIRPPEMQRMYDACVAAIAKATGAPQ